MIRSVCLAVALALFAWAGGAHANFITELTPVEKVAQSDVVVVGSVIDMKNAPRVTVDYFGFKMVFEPSYYTVKVRGTLKGAPEETIQVSREEWIPEGALPSDMVGHDYIFLLKRNPNGYYSSVNGRYGVVPILPSE